MAQAPKKRVEYFMKIWIIGLILLLSGCQFIGTIANAGHRLYSIIADDRSASDDISDIQINMAIRDKLGQRKATLMIDIEVTVFEGEVLLTGAIPNADILTDIMVDVWSVPGVRKVYNYIRTDTTPSIRDAATEAAIATQIKAKMALTQNIDAPNYKIILENGTVYLMGICNSESEYQAVQSILKTTDGVEKIIYLMRRPVEE